ncbi:MAG: glycosyltransferase [Candidatus Micrarchaeia archaeon]
MKIILHFIGSLETGGTEHMLLAYLRNSKSKELKHIVCTLHDKGELRQEFKDAGIEVVSLGVRGKADYPLAMPKFASLIKRIKPAIVHSYLLKESLIARPVCKLLGVKLISGKRDTDRGKSKWKVMLDRMTIGMCELNISNSLAGVSELKSYGIPEGKVICIPNGKDISKLDIELTKSDAKKKLGFSKDDVLLGCVARLYEFKGQEYAIRAMPEIIGMKKDAEKRKEIKLVLVGDGEMRSSLEKLVQFLGLESNVVFLGERKDIPELLRAFDIFVFPSLREGMPGALMEAMASGLPVVATDIDGNRELIINGKNGILIPVKNSGAIARAVGSLLNNKKTADQLGKSANRTIKERFSVEGMAAKLDKIYERY